ncbi:DUF7507 domain-containing protein [Paenibacillus protaetiae]|uniref:DUF7507 domain-containing protein n=1 Tax=Paenibacillus protaetiae TaxID=2509456 RepID=UPI0013EB2776|nr:SBBP repeat-containing protein [Paenibacillus protaetiae]
MGRGIAVDGAGSAYVTGQTLSPDFPVTPGAFQMSIGGAQDAFVTKLSPDGGFLEYSTFLGGEGTDTGYAITVDNFGNAYITGATTSTGPVINTFSFPATNSFGPRGNEDVFITKLDSGGSALLYSVLLGGQGIDEGRGIALDSFGNAYVTGLTTSADFPTTPGAFQISLSGVISAFVTKLDETGSVLLYSTYLEGSGDDEGHGIAVDELNQAYVTGSTTSFDFPVTPGSFQPFYGGGSSDAFVTKLSFDGNYLVYSTFLGGSESDAGNGIALRSDFAYVTGSTGSFNFPVTPDAFQPFYSGSGDGFIAQLNITGNELVFSTFIGGSSNDTGNAVAVDHTGCVFITGQTFSFDLPVTPGAVQPFLHGGSDAFIVRICLSLGTTVKKFPDRFEVNRGEQVTYTIDIHNPSAITLTNVTVNDPLLGIFEIIPFIPPFSTHIVQFTYIVPFEQPLGILRNIVFVTSDQITGPPLEADSEILVTGTPILEAVKTVNPPAAFPGDTVIFTIRLGNNGDADLAHIHLFDPLLGLNEFIDSIPPGAEFVIEWAFQIPPDAQAGLSIANTVTIIADNLPPEEIGTVVEVLPVPRLDIFKTADRNIVFPGETVHFTIEVINTGNSDLFNVHVTDDLTGFDVVIPSLFPGEAQFFVVPFVVPLEVNPQTYTNTAIASSEPTGDVSASTEITVPDDPRLGIAKFPETFSVVPGQTIRYIVLLQNIGNVPLTGIRIIDPVLGIDEAVPDLAVGEVREHLFTFTVPRDVLLGSDIVNILKVETGETGPQDVEAVVTVTGFGLSLLKQPDRAAALPGEEIVYTLTVTNLLDVPQTNVVLIDELLGFNETIPLLQPNETITLSLTFNTPLDAEIGSVIHNTFIVESDQTPPQVTDADVTVVAPPGPLLLILKLPDRNAAAPGETVTYTLSVTNLLSTSQTNVLLVDDLLGLSQTIPVLLPNETINLTLTFTVPADAEPGSLIRNVLTASSDQSPEAETAAEVTVQEPPGPSLLIHKIPDRNAAKPGETVTYTLTVTNLLGVPQTNIVLTDALLGLNETIPLLPANDTITLTFTFTIPADAEAGSMIRNVLTASSDQSPEVETTAEITVQEPSPETTLTVRKLPDRSAVLPGNTIRYTIEVTNTGENPATNVNIQDSLTGQQFTIEAIAPGRTATVHVEYSVPSDAAQGTVIANRVTVTWPEQPPGSLPAEDEARVTVAKPAELPELEVEAAPESPAPGETVIKTITVTNVTNAALTNVHVFDQTLGFRTVIPSLAPGEVRVFTLQLAIPAGTQGGTQIRNIVSKFSDQTPLQQEDVIIEIQSLPNASLTETVDRPSGRPGETVIFTIQACNTGNVPLLNTRITGTLFNLQVHIEQFAVGACHIIRVPFVLPDVDEDTLIASPVTLVSDNGPAREATASVRVIAEEEE